MSHESESNVSRVRIMFERGFPYIFYMFYFVLSLVIEILLNFDF
jgi:hypothetical protein